jgi:hypothetical protein
MWSTVFASQASILGIVRLRITRYQIGPRALGEAQAKQFSGAGVFEG